MGRIKSFTYAIRGMALATREEYNFRIHLFAMTVALVLGFYLELSRQDWIVVILTIGFVLVTELINTAIENICDHVTPEQHPAIARIKDVSAAAVLISAMTAMIIALLIYYPYL